MALTPIDPPRVAAAHRLNFRFSGRADRAACLVADGDHAPRVEAWTFRSATAEARTLPTARGESVRTQPLPAQDGRVLLVRNGPGRHEVVVVGGDAGRTVEHPVATLSCPALRAIPSRDAATLGWLVAVDGAGHTTLHRVDARTLRLDPVVELPGRLTGEGWLTEQGDLLAANQLTAGRRRAVTVDLRRATVAPLDAVDGAVLLTSPARQRVLVAHRTPEGTRLGWAGRDGSPPRYPAALNTITGTVLPLAVDPTGRRLAVRVTVGAGSRLLVHDDDTDEVATLPLPPGVVRSAGWDQGGLRLLWSSPTCPTTVATLPARPGRDDRPRLVPHPGGGTGSYRDGGWHDARVEWFDGPAGPVEAVVYGDRRRSRHLLVALHGGPEAAWDLAFDPFFQSLADAGVAVVAPNQRGSTGYGSAHRDAIIGAWGGPDLADIRWLRVALTRDRPPAAPAPMLFGASYGAFLALLATAADPDGWSRCAVVAPFLSGPLLYRDGSPAVRALLDRLGGHAPVDDDLGPRDLLRLAPRIRVPLLVVHGQRDDVIPVGHSRALARRLAELGRRTPEDVRYREVADGGHNPLDEAGGWALRAEVVDFLTQQRRGFRTGERRG